MTRAMQFLHEEASDREPLRRRVRQMYGWLNREFWEKCFSLIDPKLREKSKVDLSDYVERSRVFKEAYGAINLWHIRISLHLDASSNKHDERPFAYVYVIWQDNARGFHMFRERWVKHAGGWFTRVIGLVPNKQESVTS